MTERLTARPAPRTRSTTEVIASWPILAQVSGSLVACAAVGALAGAAWGFLTGGIVTALVGMRNEGEE